MRIVAIVQARMGSTRLPGKVLRDLAGEPMLARVVARLQRSQRMDAVGIATSTLATDDILAEFCARHGVDCFRGSENDVLDRYLGAARASRAEAVVRITSDCPLIDPGVVDETVALFLAGQPHLDYACNFHPQRTFPRGLDTEVFRLDVLERCHHEAADPASREHVTSFIYRQPESFRVQGLANAQDCSAHRWTVDTAEDLALTEEIYRFFGHDRFTWREALSAVIAHPDWSSLNSHIAQKLV